jgi:hypothetical protein
MEFDFTLHDADHKLIPLDTSTIDGPWFPRWMAFAKLAASQRGADVNAASNMRQWITENGAFEDIVYREFWLPTCPWQKGDDPRTAWWRSVGEVMRDDIYVCFPFTNWAITFCTNTYMVTVFLESGSPSSTRKWFTRRSGQPARAECEDGDHDLLARVSSSRAERVRDKAT